jgi:hypothetical protein
MNKQSYETPKLIDYGKISQKTKAGNSDSSTVDNSNDYTYGS